MERLKRAVVLYVWSPFSLSVIVFEPEKRGVKLSVFSRCGLAFSVHDGDGNYGEDDCDYDCC